jgi:predicted nucleic acid-binding protein
MPSPVVFSDTFYWVAVLSPRDPFHPRVMSWGRNRGTTRLITTDDVLTEVLNWFSSAGPYWRGKAAAFVHDLRGDPDVDVLPQTRADFDAALALYETRLDKSYSLTDCRSMVALRTLGVSEVLTNDHHFTQEGFAIVFP